MKKKAKIIIAIVVVLCATYIYAHIDKPTIIYDKNVDTSKYKSTGVILEEGIEQSFISKENVLDGITFKCSIVGDVSDVVMKYSLIEKESMTEVATGTFDSNQVKANKFYRIKFKQQEACKQKEYIFKISSMNATVEAGIGAFYEPTTRDATQLTIEEKETEGTMIMKMISHRFDIETFVVMLCFVTYIVVFIKMLYRLFK